MFKGLNNVIYKLQLIEKSQPLIMKMFFQRATDWIIDEANFKLESSLYWDKNTFGPNMYERSENGWKVEILNDKAILTNEFENSASVEFGIGVVGANQPHPIASSVGLFSFVSPPSIEGKSNSFLRVLSLSFEFSYASLVYIKASFASLLRP